MKTVLGVTHGFDFFMLSYKFFSDDDI